MDTHYAIKLASARRWNFAPRELGLAVSETKTVHRTIHKKISRRGVSLVKRFEGYVGHPYRDGAGVWTIGYGHTEGVGPRSHFLTKLEASALLARDLDTHYAPYVTATRVPMTQNEFDATVSFVYNLGPGVLDTHHDFGRALHARHYDAAANAMLEYDKDISGVLEPGLRTRRAAERRLFLSHA